MNNSLYKPAPKEELLFIREHMPRFMVAMIQERTGLNRSQVLYQLLQMPDNQNPDVVQAARDILYAVKLIRYPGIDNSAGENEGENILPETTLIESECNL